MRGASLELTGGGIVLRPVALRALEVENHVHLDSLSKRRGAWALDGCLLVENPLSDLLLAVVWSVDLSSEEAGWLVGLRLAWKEESARLSFQIRLFFAILVHEK